MKVQLTTENRILIFTMFCLVAIGVGSMWSIMSLPASVYEQPLLSTASIVKLLSFQPIKQTIFAIGGFLLFILLLRMNYYKLKDYSFIFYLIILGLLVVLVGWGRISRGTRAWFSLGPFALQPSEFMKIATSLMLARWMMHQTNISSVAGMIVPFIIATVPMGLVMLQPDLGSALVFLPMLFVMLFVAGARVKYLAITAVLIALSLPVAYFGMLKDYQRMRLQVFINPDKSPTADAYQLISSKIAVGAGGVLGRGLITTDEYTPTVFVPERHNDFIFTIIGEKGGFLGTTVVLLLYFALFITALFIATTTREPFGRLIVSGLVTLMAVQVFINIAMTIGLAPITGITLPLISYGGSSLLATFIALALINNIRIKQIPSFAVRDF